MKTIKILSGLLLSIMFLVSCGAGDTKPGNPDNEPKGELKKIMLHEANMEMDIMKYISDCKINPGNGAELTLKNPDEAGFNPDDFLGSWAASMFWKVQLLEKITIHVNRNGQDITFSVSRKALADFWNIDLQGMNEIQWNEFWKKESTLIRMQEYIAKFSE